MTKKKQQKKTEKVKQMKEFLALGAFALSLGIHPSMAFSADISSTPHSSAAIKTADADSQSNELEALRQKLLKTARELHEYKAQLFRSSHPKDEAKIAELGQLLSEKEALNQRLAIALQNMDKEVSLARKQLNSNETANDILCSYIETQRQSSELKDREHKEQLAQLEGAFLREHRTILDKISLYEADQQKLLADLSDSHRSQDQWQSAFEQQGVINRSLMADIGDLSNLLSLIQQMHQEDLSNQAGRTYTYVEFAELEKQASQTDLKNKLKQLSDTIENEQHAALQLANEISALQQMLIAQAKKTDELEKGEWEAVAFAHDVSHKLIETEAHYASVLEQSQNSSNSQTAQLGQQVIALSNEIKQKELEYEALRRTHLEEKIDQLSYLSDLQTLQKELGQLETQLADAKQQIEEQENHKLDKLALLSDLQILYSQLSTVEAQLAAAGQLLAEKEEQIEVSKLQFEQQQVIHAALATRLEGAEMQHGQVSQHQLAALQDLEQSKAALSTKVEQLNQQFNATANEIQQKELEMNTLQAELLQEKVHQVALLSDLHFLRRDLSILESKLADAKQTVTEKEAQLAVAESEAAQQQAKHLELAERTQCTESQHEMMHQVNYEALSTLEQSKAALNGEIEQMNQQIAAISQEIRRKEEELNALRRDLMQEKVSHVALIADFGAIQHEIETLKTDLAAANSSIAEKESRLTVQREASDNHLSNVTELAARLLDTENLHEELHRQHANALRELEHSKASLINELETLHTQLDKETIESQNLLKHLQALSLKHADLGEKDIELEMEINHLSLSIRDKESQMAQAVQKINSLEEEVQRLTSALLASYDEHTELMSSQRTESDTTIAHLTRKLNELALAFETEMTQQNEMKQAIQQLLAHTNEQESCLSDTAKINRTLETENNYLKFRIKEMERTDRVLKAQNMLKAPSNASQISDNGSHDIKALRPLLRNE